MSHGEPPTWWHCLATLLTRIEKSAASQEHTIRTCPSSMDNLCIWSMVSALPFWKNISSSIGMMKFPRYGTIEHVPNHQPDKHILHKMFQTTNQTNTSRTKCSKPPTKQPHPAQGFFKWLYNIATNCEMQHLQTIVEQYPCNYCRLPQWPGATLAEAPKFTAFLGVTPVCWWNHH